MGGNPSAGGGMRFRSAAFRSAAGRARGALLLGCGSLVVCLLLAEGGLRAALDEVDYLQPRLAPHPELLWTIVPGSGGHDAWGFRNREVPERADVVAIGDSQTYGVSSPMAEAWPGWLARSEALSVYNLGLGGYGPPDYAFLFREYVPRLAPRAVVIGFYFGNDLPRAAEGPGGGAEVPAHGRTGEDDRLFGELRSWLAGHSLLYQVLKYELPALTDALRRREAQASGGPGLVWLGAGALRTALAPELRGGALDQAVARNREGVARTLESFEAIRADCEERGIECLFLLIPTKESVYRDVARAGLAPQELARVDAVVASEESVRAQLTAFLRERGAQVVDPLPALRARAADTLLYPANHDGHPTGAGYRVIAEAVAEALRCYLKTCSPVP